MGHETDEPFDERGVFGEGLPGRHVEAALFEPMPGFLQCLQSGGGLQLRTQIGVHCPHPFEVRGDLGPLRQQALTETLVAAQVGIGHAPVLGQVLEQRAQGGDVAHPLPFLLQETDVPVQPLQLDADQQQQGDEKDREYEHEFVQIAQTSHQCARRRQQSVHDASPVPIDQQREIAQGRGAGNGFSPCRAEPSHLSCRAEAGTGSVVCEESSSARRRTLARPGISPGRTLQDSINARTTLLQAAPMLSGL